MANRLGLIGPVVEQPQYNLLTRQRVEDEYRWLYRKFGTGLTIWSPLYQGVLTGKYNGVDKPPEGSRLAEAKDKPTVAFSQTFGDETWQKNLAAVDKLKPLVEEFKAESLTLLALAWAIKNENVSSVILGASRVEQVTENLRALEIAKTLDEKKLKKIDEVLGNGNPAPPERLG